VNEQAHRGGTQGSPLVNVVDTDVHPVTRTDEELAEYTPEPWRTRYFGRRGGSASTSPMSVFSSPQMDLGGARRDAVPPHGGRPASDPEFTQQQLFERAGVDYAILVPLIARLQVNPELEAALCGAVNRWLADTWLSTYNTNDVFRGTLRVACSDPDLMVAEVERWVGHPGFVQVMLDPGNPVLLGEPRYDRFYALCQEANLALGFHVIKTVRFQTPVGTPSYWTDYATPLPLAYAAQLVSMIYGGVFERFPRLRVAFIEGGFSWVLPLMYRMDRQWKALRSEIPGARRRPSDYLREQIRFDTQPFEESPNTGALDRMFDYLECDDLFMFATDYPHFDFDDPLWVYKRIPARMRDGVLRDNALAFYQLPRKSAGHVLTTAGS
jgi:predicted TIM-barrel fold metal-dependent hydrolase